MNLENFLNLIVRILNKLVYIGRLIITTPNFGLIIVLQAMSGLFNFVGLPMIISLLDFLRPDGQASQAAQSLGPLTGIIKFFGLEPNFVTLMAITSFLILFGQILVVVSTLVAVWAQNNLSQKYREELLHAFINVDWLWLTTHHSGELYYAIIKEADLASVAHLNAQRLVIFGIQGLVYTALIIKLSPFSALLALGFYLVLGIINVLNSRKVSQLNYNFNIENEQLSKLMSGLHRNKKFFKTSLLNSAFLQSIFKTIERIIMFIKKVNLREQLQMGWTFTMTFMFLIFLVAFHRQLAIGYSQLLLMVLVFNRLAPQFANFSNAYLALNANIPMHSSFNRRLRDLERNRELNGNEAFDGRGSIRFEKVTFKYPNGNTILKDLDLLIEANKTSAFVGTSGAGKTTVLDLVLGLLRPDSGYIYYGNIPHSKLDINSLRSKIAYISQQTTLLDGTLKENLIIGCPDATDEMIRDVCKRAHIDKFVEQLPEGLDTMIGENGIKLSGGQRQRLVIGRSLFMKPEILILDEATSELDLESEAIIQETINDLSKELTIIIVAHRLSTVKLADTIYVLEDGSICESGAYKELLEKKGRFYYLDSLQRVG